MVFVPSGPHRSSYPEDLSMMTLVCLQSNTTLSLLLFVTPKDLLGTLIFLLLIPLYRKPLVSKCFPCCGILLTYLPTDLLTYLRTYLLTYLLSYLWTYLFTYVRTYRLTDWLSYLPTYWLTNLFTYLLTYLLTYLRFYLLHRMFVFSPVFPLPQVS